MLEFLIWAIGVWLCYVYLLPRYTGITWWVCAFVTITPINFIVGGIAWAVTMVETNTD